MQEPPHFDHSLEDQTVAPGSSARLTCHLTGRQTAAYILTRLSVEQLEAKLAQCRSSRVVHRSGEGSRRHVTSRTFVSLFAPNPLLQHSCHAPSLTFFSLSRVKGSRVWLSSASLPAGTCL